MSKKYTIGNYEYSELSVFIGSMALVTGIIYGIRTHKTISGTTLIAMICGVVGFSIGAMLKTPKRIN